MYNNSMDLRPVDTQSDVIIPSKPESILFILSQSVCDFRLTLAARRLRREGYEVKELTTVPYYELCANDLTITTRPNESVCDYLVISKKAKHKVIVDMDDNFYAIPPDNPGYLVWGLGNPTYQRQLKNAFRYIDGFTSPSADLIKIYGFEGIGRVMPNCYDSENELWKLSKNRFLDKTVIGFTGTTTHRKDFALCVDAVRQVLKEREDTAVIIGTDTEIFAKFMDIPEDRKLFIPGLAYNDYPLMFQNMDMLLVPLEDNVFNRGKSSIKLIEAGAAGIPWIASRIPVYEQYSEEVTGSFDIYSNNGVFVDDGDWYGAIMTYVDNQHLRLEQGKSGRLHAENYTSDRYGDWWLEYVREILAQ